MCTTNILYTYIYKIDIINYILLFKGTNKPGPVIVYVTESRQIQTRTQTQIQRLSIGLLVRLYTTLRKTKIYFSTYIISIICIFC